MREWFSVELVLGVLLVTSFTITGLVALWAATSTRHWFLRTVVVLVLLSPLLAIPAYEPFLVFAIETFVIVTGLQCRPFVNRRIQITEAPAPAATNPHRPRALRFLLRTLLLATPVVAGIALLAPLVQFPFWGPVLIFALESGAILACAATWLAARQLGRAIRRHKVAFTTAKIPQSTVDQSAPTPGFQFSLQTLLLLTPLIAVFVAIGAQMWATLGRQSVESIITIGVDGVAGGIVVLLAAWMAVSRRKALIWPLALVCSVGISAAPAYFDWLFTTLVTSNAWPPNPAALAILFGVLNTHPAFAWFFVLPATLLLTLLATVLYRIGPPLAGGTCGPVRRSRVAARGVLAVLFAALAAVPTSIVWTLLHPLPLPQIALPDPNGLDQIVAAGNALTVSPILNLSREPKSTAELAAEVAKFQAAYDQLHLGLSREIRFREWPKQEDLDKSFKLSVDTFTSARSAARGLVREAELAQQQHRLDDAIRCSFDNMRLGMDLPRDGMIIDYLVGIAIEGVGHNSLYSLIADLDRNQCRTAIATLQKLEAGRESLDDVIYRDRIWSQHVYGWYGHLMQIFEDINPRWQTETGVREALHRTQAVSRLLVTELAIRAYRVEHESPPDSLSALVSTYLDQIPVDPFDPAGGPLRYTRTENGYVLYSLGQNHRDDNGQQDRDEYGVLNQDGDLRLDIIFAPEPPTTPTSGDNGDGATADETQPANTDANKPDK